jgi:adenosine kinase
MTTPSYQLFCIGNPLLDIQVTQGEELLKKYDLKANDAILAEEKHLPLCVLIACLGHPKTHQKQVR